MPLPGREVRDYHESTPSLASSSTSLQQPQRSSTATMTTPYPPPGPKPPHQPNLFIKRYRTQFAAISGTAISTFFAFPLESIKTRLQADSPSFKHCVRTVWQEEGLRGFWRGCAAPMFSVTLVRTFGFSVYQNSKYSASRAIANIFDREEPLITVNRPGSKPDWATMACFGWAGAVSGAFSTSISCPFELTKNAMVLAKQIQVSGNTGKPDNHPIRSSYVNKGTFATARQIVRNCGWTGLYCGFNLQLTREIIGTATYFMTYESIKQYMVAAAGSNNPTSPLAVAFAGGLCGMISLTVTYPMDLAKTAYQKRRLELGKAAGLRSPKVRYFAAASYQGLGVASVRSAITNAILFSFFERVKKYINEIPDSR